MAQAAALTMRKILWIVKKEILVSQLKRIRNFPKLLRYVENLFFDKIWRCLVGVSSSSHFEHNFVVLIEIAYYPYFFWPYRI